MRIVMLAPFGIRPKGTLLSRMLPLAQALVRRGHAVEIAAPPVHNPQDAGRRDSYGGVTVAHTRLPRPGHLLPAADQVAMLARQALAATPDLVHLFKPKGYSGLAALLLGLLRPGLPLVVDTDDWEGWGGWNDLLPYPRPAKHLFAWQERDLPRRAAAVTVASRTLETQVWGFGVPPERVVYLPNGVAETGDGRRETGDGRHETRDTRHETGETRHETRDKERGRGREGEQSRIQHSTILLYTRFWEFSLVDVVQALVAIVQRRPDARLLVVGRGERGEERELLELAARAGVGGTVDYRGWAEPEQLPTYFAAADLAIYPVADRLINRAKCPAKLIEQMAAGLPVVAGRVGQVAEYIEDGQSGLLVAPDNGAALARGVLALLDDAELRARLGRGARERMAQQYSWDRLALAAERAYRIGLG